MLTIKEAAKKLNYSPRWVRDMCITGKLPAKKVHNGRKWLITEEALNGLANKSEPIETLTQNALHKVAGVVTATKQDLNSAPERKAPTAWTVSKLEELGFPEDVALLFLGVYKLGDEAMRKLIEETVGIKGDNPGMEPMVAFSRACEASFRARVAHLVAHTEDELAKEILEGFIDFAAWKGEKNLNAFRVVYAAKLSAWEQEQERQRKLKILQAKLSAWEQEQERQRKLKILQDVLAGLKKSPESTPPKGG